MINKKSNLQTKKNNKTQNTQFSTSNENETNKKEVFEPADKNLFGKNK